jgi:hypothetical protein
MDKSKGIPPCARFIDESLLPFSFFLLTGTPPPGQFFMISWLPAFLPISLFKKFFYKRRKKGSEFSFFDNVSYN